MRIVLDSNVLVSALLNPHGAPGSVLNGILDGRISLLADNRILFEYEDVLRRDKFRFDSEDVRALLDFLRAEAEYISASPVPDHFDDPDDLPFFEVAKAGQAQFLVTGNRRHYPDEEWVVSPQHFLGLYSARE